MSLKYYSAYNSTRKSTPKEYYYEDFEAMQDLAFENAPNVYYGDSDDAVEFEYVYGSNQFRPVPMVRIDEVLSYNTGIYDNDDFKVFIFKHDFIESNKLSYGSKFKWKNNIWLVISAGIFNGMANSVEVRRCNNIARFYDEWGQEVYEPCILDMTLRFTRNNDSDIIITSNGEQKLWLQRNNRTVHIKGNQRFLFGPKESRVAYKVYASGSKDYINTITNEDNSQSLTEIYMQFDQIDEQRDDIVRGFADARVAFYSVQGKDISGEYKVGDVIPLIFSVYKDKDIVDLDVSYSIDNPGVAVINGNELIIQHTGNFMLTVAIADNPNINKQFEIKVVEEPKFEYQIKLNPSNQYVLQNTKQVFTCALYKNGAIESQDITFEFKDDTIGVPKEKYSIEVIDGTHFALHNKGMFMKHPVRVLCQCGEHSQEFDFELRGVY